MAEPVERPERLVEILREMIALSKGTNASDPARSNDLVDSLGAQRLNRINHRGSTGGDETGLFSS
jgi:hypothetical protein